MWGKKKTTTIRKKKTENGNYADQFEATYQNTDDSLVISHYKFRLYQNFTNKWSD